MSGICYILCPGECNNIYHSLAHLGAVVVVVVWLLDLQQPVPITTKVVRSNPVHGESY